MKGGRKDGREKGRKKKEGRERGRRGRRKRIEGREAGLQVGRKEEGREEEREEEREGDRGSGGRRRFQADPSAQHCFREMVTFFWEDQPIQLCRKQRSVVSLLPSLVSRDSSSLDEK